MTDRAVTRRDIEAKIGVDPIDVLQAKRRALIEANAKAEAMFGKNGTYEARRKQLLAVYLIEHRDRYLNMRPAVKMPAADILAAEAEADPRYREWLKTMHDWKAEWIVETNAITECTERINRDQALIRYAANEPH